MIELIGTRKGRLVVLEEAYRNGHNVYMKCKCDCGNTCYVGRRQLLKKVGGTESCGCIRDEKTRERIHVVKPYMYNPQNANKTKAMKEFEEALTKLGIDYNIPGDVIESYCDNFKKKLRIL